MKPYYEDESVTIYHGDCRGMLPLLDRAGYVVITDPPYGDTALDWDVAVDSWWRFVRARQFWAFGSMRYWIRTGPEIARDGWSFAQDLIWEKHNGSSFMSDRFRRVHELICHWYRSPWNDLFHSVPTVNEATRRSVFRSKRRPNHFGAIGTSGYRSEDGGPLLMRSVIQERSCHGSALHPTQKPMGIVRALVEYSCPVGGVVIDPFAGSGSTLRAAKDLGRKAIGIEMEEKYCEIAAKRMSQGVLGFQPIRTESAEEGRSLIAQRAIFEGDK